MKKNALLMMVLITFFSCQKKIISDKPVDLRNMANMTIEDLITEEPYELLIINYFASYCSPCKKELPILEEFHNEYANRGVRIVSLSTESERIANTIEIVLKALGVSFPAYYNAPGTIFGDRIVAVPATYVVDKEKVVIKKYVGVFKKAALRTIIEENSIVTEFNIPPQEKQNALPSSFMEVEESKKLAMYNISTSKEGDYIIFKGNKPYELGGEGYPPVQLTVYIDDGDEDLHYEFEYDKEGYVLSIEEIGGGLIKGHIKAPACTRSTCLFIDEDFEYMIN